MSQHMQRKIFYIIVMSAMVLFLVGHRIYDVYFAKNDDNIIENILDPANPTYVVEDKSIIYFSDSSIDSEEIEIKAEKLSTMFENAGYKYTERVKEYGMYNGVSPLISYETKELKTTEYFILNAGFIDMILSAEIGDFDGNEYTTAGYLKEFIDYAAENAKELSIILVGIPAYDESYFTDEYKYNPDDYNFLFQYLDEKYDNVYYLDMYSKTIDNPIKLENSYLTYDYNVTKILFDGLIEKIGYIERNKNNK